ncbi:transcriptional regulator, AraC family [Lachnospiraceae bacterium KM106-2]|nr:transcriptional regulator, AraC family [Lachnospiraceae bacterium KM106-2]
MKQEDWIVPCFAYIEEHIKEAMGLNEIAGHMGYSVYYFSRAFKAEMGITIMEYVKRRKMIRATEEILSGMRIIDVAFNYGYQSHSAFTKAFTKEFGLSPAILRAYVMQKTELGGGSTMSHFFMEETKIHATKEELLEQLLTVIRANQLEYQLDNIQKGYEFACRVYEGVKRYSGDDYVTHPLNVAILLADMGAGEDAVIAGMLCDALAKGSMDEETILENTSKNVSDLLLLANNFHPEDPENEESVVLLKLAERLHNMRTIDFMSVEQQKEKAKETLTLFMPIANRLGNEGLKEELNNLAIKYM